LRCEVDGAPQSVVVVVLGGARGLKADQAVGVAVMGKEGAVGSVALFDDRAAVVVVINIAAVAQAMAGS